MSVIGPVQSHYHEGSPVGNHNSKQTVCSVLLIMCCNQSVALGECFPTASTMLLCDVWSVLLEPETFS